MTFNVHIFYIKHITEQHTRTISPDPSETKWPYRKQSSATGKGTNKKKLMYLFFNASTIYNETLCLKNVLRKQILPGGKKDFVIGVRMIKS
jgi:hypothetical protein